MKTLGLFLFLFIGTVFSADIYDPLDIVASRVYNAKPNVIHSVFVRPGFTIAQSSEGAINAIIKVTDEKHLFVTYTGEHKTIKFVFKSPEGLYYLYTINVEQSNNRPFSPFIN